LEATRIIGSDHEERAVLVREYLRRWNPKHVEGPNAESFEQFIARVDAFLLRVSALEHSATAVSHAWFMKAVLWRGGHSGKIDANAMKSYWAFANRFEIRNCQWFRIKFGTEG
jgi:broad specificity phosphatase PhoE